jgi:hypothetical protein
VPEDVHAGVVKELIRLGWVEEISGWYQITSSGRQARDQVEAETDRLFFAPWAGLNEADLEDLACFAFRMRDGLRK